MEVLSIGVSIILATFLTKSVAAVTTFTSPYFYTTDPVAYSDIECKEEEYPISFENACTAKCVQHNCYKYFHANDVCRITRRKQSSPGGGVADEPIAFTKVRLAGL